MYVLIFQDEALIIDPCTKWERTSISDVEVKSILCTHGHFDHISRADVLAAAFGCPIYISSEDLPMFSSAELNCSATFGLDQTVTSNAKVFEHKLFHAQDLGISREDFTMEIIPTPGHTEGSVCLLFHFQDGEHALFTGDMLFSGSVGRTDLGGNEKQMLHSIELLKKFDDDLVCYPGHGPMTVLGREKRTNPFFN